MALLLRPYHAQRFIHQKVFYPNPTKMCRHLHCEAHWTRSAVEIQHGSSAQAFNAKPTGPDQHGSSSQVISPAALHPSEASRNSDKNVEASSFRRPLDQISG